jgi:hypothetical protein
MLVTFAVLAAVSAVVFTLGLLVGTVVDRLVPSGLLR